MSEEMKKEVLEQEQKTKETETVETEIEVEEDVETKKEPEKKYTDDDVDAIVKKKYARWKEKLADEKAEAEKLAKMDAEQKAQYEIEKLQKENNELKRAKQRAEMAETASNLLTDKGITATKDVIALVVTDEADTTKSNIDSLETIIKAELKKAELERAKGTTPKATTDGEKDPFKDKLNKYRK